MSRIDDKGYIFRDRTKLRDINITFNRKVTYFENMRINSPHKFKAIFSYSVDKVQSVNMYIEYHALNIKKLRDIFSQGDSKTAAKIGAILRKNKMVKNTAKNSQNGFFFVKILNKEMDVLSRTFKYLQKVEVVIKEIGDKNE